jgi:hypothetical protein
MTERTRGSQLTGSPPEAIDLNELHASKVRDTSLSSETRPANTDLASASIQSISVVRLSARPERRKVASPTLSLNGEPTVSTETKSPAPSRQRRGATFGVLKNPYYKYEGNPFERLISLVANLLKVIEHSLLKSFKPQTPPTPPTTIVVKTKRRGPDGQEIDEDKETPPQRNAEQVKLHRE